MHRQQEGNVMRKNRPITEIISERFSNRTYHKRPIRDDHREKIEEFLSAGVKSPFGSETRFRLIAASDEDMNSLRDLGTYGMIKNAQGFIVGAVKVTEKCLEDYGFMLERIVLFATGLGLGTCWLGGTFKKSGFARSISLRDNEALPAVIATGYSMDKPSIRDSIIRFGAGSKNRKPWQSLFFSGEMNSALTEKTAGAYRVPLEMVRLAPSASNKQPWRIIKDIDGEIFHLYLQRSKGYDKNWKLLGREDLQRIDMGIAMCHFEVTAREAGLMGKWDIDDPGLDIPAEGCEYVVTWKGK
jgi:hypothetical protein